MTTLADMQREFMAHILEEGRDKPDEWGEREQAGMTIYRTGYRARLVDSIMESYERTRHLAGEDAFRQAAINHLIARPPAGWSIEEVGADLDETLAALYPDRPDLAELAAIEAAMQVAARAEDASPLTAEQFGQETASFGEDNWASLRLEFLPGMTVLPTEHLWTPIWADLALSAEDAAHEPAQRLEEAGVLLIWREEEQPVFVARSWLEGEALKAMMGGQGFGALCEHLAVQIAALNGAPNHAEPDPAFLEAAVGEAGQMLGSWVQLGLVTQVSA